MYWKTTVTAHLRAAHFNHPTQFSWTDYESFLTVTSSDSEATEPPVSISLGLVFAVEMASTTASHMN